MKKAEKIDALKKLKAYVKSDKFGRNYISQYQGLCAANYELSCAGTISLSQYDFIGNIIRQKDVEMNPAIDRGDYLWQEGAKAPRIKWINEQIKKLEKK